MNTVTTPKTPYCCICGITRRDCEMFADETGQQFATLRCCDDDQTFLPGDRPEYVEAA